MKELQHCPICQSEVTYSQRYPQYICNSCVELITDKEGRPVEFFNTTILGQGCEGIYQDTGEQYAGDTCYVRGVLCKAKEHRFGGIVVEVVESGIFRDLVILDFQ
ncbi:hypothetical protein [Mongoliitalea daihaiensis]|uniref:hypothetical protein n=1 Tax=Mongoliitalea daihaiensis TaxID=2782006 RepID=UPI001F3C35C5|nr:hypothetical protein [Mongoliitalea daihaiensis]UJP66700.1 hypothetical protein IPZ59_08990 [Mongoliitalea daihaiensis]